MGLDEDAVDLFEIDGADLVAHGFDQGTEAEIASATQESSAGANDERQRLGGEGIVAETGAVELGQDERFDGFRCQARKNDRVSDAGTDFLVDGQGQGLEKRRLSDEDEVRCLANLEILPGFSNGG